jgi:hypothetical protein
MHRWLLRCVLCCLCAARIGEAQEFRAWNRTVQVHGFLSQGFVKTDQNNWLTMNTRAGSGAMTDMGLNMSSQLTDKFRVGAQVYDRNLGQLGQWHPSVDWAVADYRFTNWLGVRAGKVKTTLGLYNDSQDLDFAHVFALLPQAVYPTDIRDSTIAHTGADIYGTLALGHHWGDLLYTAYAGHRSDSIYSGYPYMVRQWGSYLTSYGGLQYGADVRWNPAVPGLTVGASRMNQDISAKGVYPDFLNPAAGIVPYFESCRQDWTNQFYGRYEIRRFAFNGEYRRSLRDQLILNGSSADVSDARGWYVSGTFRLMKKLRIGSYYTRYTVTDFFTGALSAVQPDLLDTGQPSNHMYDKVVTARVDVNRFWDVKIEGHFIDGYATAGYPVGFYAQQNPSGFQPDTNGLVVKTGFHF